MNAPALRTSSCSMARMFPALPPPAIALAELDIAVVIVTGAFLIAFGALALGFALAFGLGSRRAVEIMWEKRLTPKEEPPESKDEKPKDK